MKAWIERFELRKKKTLLLIDKSDKMHIYKMPKRILDDIVLLSIFEYGEGVV